MNKSYNSQGSKNFQDLYAGTLMSVHALAFNKTLTLYLQRTTLLLLKAGQCWSTMGDSTAESANYMSTREIT